jgi:hypothetical protein
MLRVCTSRERRGQLRAKRRILSVTVSARLAVSAVSLSLRVPGCLRGFPLSPADSSFGAPGLRRERWKRAHTRLAPPNFTLKLSITRPRQLGRNASSVRYPRRTARGQRADLKQLSRMCSRGGSGRRTVQPSHSCSQSRRNEQWSSRSGGEGLDDCSFCCQNTNAMAERVTRQKTRVALAAEREKRIAHVAPPNF